MLDSRRVSVREERQSKRQPLSDAEVKALLKSVSEVVIARGKTIRMLAASEARPADLKGPTGSYRAPMVKKGRTLLVGFSEEALGKLLS